MNWADFYRKQGILPRYGNFVGPEWSGGSSFPSVYDMIHVQPVDLLDAIAKEHDLRYFVAQNTQDIQEADRTFLKQLDEALRNQWLTNRKERVAAQIAKAAMLVKSKAEQKAGPLYGRDTRVLASQRERVTQYLKRLDDQGGLVQVFRQKTSQL